MLGFTDFTAAGSQQVGYAEAERNCSLNRDPTDKVPSSSPFCVARSKAQPHLTQNNAYFGFNLCDDVKHASLVNAGGPE